ncbi:hypothetical protein [Duganella sp. Root336D2]|uniref:hypothetical protein n=1 Tax=Duganella sp. Root336D2 TaxID=1736518 RepID=UPI0006F68E89|nr:hypothetical protein [Duganella sp. Root336D2]KQV51036.1 hypothetical protein ASD07_08950 [Duganella sp. Root336D2]
MNQYATYAALKSEMVASVGYAGRLEVPTALVRKIAEFLDAYPDDSMTTYYANSLLDQFYRKRTKERSIRLFELLSSFLKNKSPLIDLFLHRVAWRQDRFRAEQCFDAATIWSAIRDLDDGYDKANCIGQYAYLLTDEVASQAYHTILELHEPYKTRALAGIYPRMDTLRKTEILSYLLQQFASGSSAAAYRLKFMFPYMDSASRAKVVAAHLGLPDVPEGLIAYLVVRNAAYFEYDDAVRLAARARLFESDYYRNRCLLKLAAFLHDGEVEKLYEQFMLDFNTQPATSARIHNLYHFGSVLKTLDPTRVISLALEKIECLDDSASDYYEQAKYGEMMFVMPLLTEAHRERAFGIAGTIRGRYGKAVVSKLNAHFTNSKDFCDFRGAPIFY